MKTKYDAYVKQVRENMPTYNHGRTVMVLSEYSAKGESIIGRASQWAGNTLGQVYDNWSDAKQRAFDEVWQMYCNDIKAEAFAICSANTHQFTVSWVTPVEVVYVTRDYEYHVLCDIPEFYE